MANEELVTYLPAYLFLDLPGSGRKLVARFRRFTIDRHAKTERITLANGRSSRVELSAWWADHRKRTARILSGILLELDPDGEEVKRACQFVDARPFDFVSDAQEFPGEITRLVLITSGVIELDPRGPLDLGRPD